MLERWGGSAYFTAARTRLTACYGLQSPPMSIEQFEAAVELLAEAGQLEIRADGHGQLVISFATAGELAAAS